MATTDEIATSYANLLTMQYQNKPKAFATIKAAVTPFILDQLPAAVENGYDPMTAVGVQLDVLAKIVGIFSPYPNQKGRVQKDFSGTITLTDDQLRQLIKIKIVQNYSKSDLSSIQDLIQRFFAGTIQVFDHGNMTMGYYFDTTFGSQEMAEVMVKGKYLPKPMGVRLNCVIYATEVLTTGFFGFKRYGETPPLSVGFRNYGTDPTGRFLTYMEAISI